MFEDKIIVVTGASRGIGKATAESFLNEGAFVIGISKSVNSNSLRHDNYLHLGCDLGSASDLVTLTETIKNRTEHIDVLIHNAGIKKRTDFKTPDIKAWDETMAVNLRAPYVLSQALATLLKPGSSIITVASQSGIGHVTKSIEYGISKAGLIYMTKSLARVMAEQGVRVNAISPGRTYTALTNYEADPEKEKEAFAHIPLGHINSPQEISDAVLFLASAKARNITGQILAIDGGECIR